jgi:hypothetical protein
MPISSAQKAAIEEVIDVLISTTPARGKRQVSSMFLDLVDRADWPEYYEVLDQRSFVMYSCTNICQCNVGYSRAAVH